MNSSFEMYQRLKSHIDSELRDYNIKGLKFLCESDLGAKKSAERFSTGFEIFDALEKSGKLSKDNLYYLYELLITIGRVDLASVIDPNYKFTNNSYRFVDSFRLMLYRLSEELTTDEVLRLRFLYPNVPKSQTIGDGLDLFLLMLQHKYVSPDKLKGLADMLGAIKRTDLSDIIVRFHNELHKPDRGIIIEMTPVEESFPVDKATLETRVANLTISGEEEPMDFAQALDKTLLTSSHKSGASATMDEPFQNCYLFENQSLCISNELSSKGGDSQNISVSSQPAQVYMQPEYVAKPAGGNSDEVFKNADDGYIPLEFYKMTANPRGICVIIDNQNFESDPRDKEAVQTLRNREGSDKDSLALKICFENLHFIIEMKKNLTDTDIINVLKEISLRDHSKFDCFVCCILTHGGENHVYGVNGRKVWLGDITSQFRAQSCNTLAQKPKLFFMATCRGRNHQIGVSVPSDFDHDASENEPQVNWIPNEADFLFGYATVLNHVSYRSKTMGTFYINALTEILNTYAKREDLQTLLVRVNDAVSKKSFEQDINNETMVYKQTPAPQHTLRKHLKFF